MDAERAKRLRATLAFAARSGAWIVEGGEPSHPPADLPILAQPCGGELSGIREEIGDCKRCPLHRGRTHIVFGVGDPNARLMFVGEGPGEDEDLQGEPFVGAAGQLLNKMILAMGTTRECVYIANIVKCRPPKNRNPEPLEAATCLPFLLQQIEAVNPAVICTLGAVATHNLLGVDDPISKLRGRKIPYNGRIVVPTYHPAYLLRSPEKKRDAWIDLQLVRDLVNLSDENR